MGSCFRQLMSNGTITEVGMSIELINKGGKVFLTSDPDQDSSVTWNVGIDHFSANDVDLFSMLKIRDCHKLVSLEFNCSSPSKGKQRLDKLDTLINELITFRATLVEGLQKQQETLTWLKRS